MRTDIRGIALIGEPGSGKSSIAQALCIQLNWQRRSFAGPLKDEVADALTSVEPSEYRTARTETTRQRFRREMDDPETKDHYRGILQWWGTEHRRGRDPMYWVRKFEMSLGFGAVGGHFVVDDARFANEFEMLKQYNFMIVKLEVGTTTRPLQGDQAIHSSEQDWRRVEPDLVLDFQLGSDIQARRIIEELELA